MKVLAVLFLCAVVAVQGRSAISKTSKAVAALGENPWVVHLRIAVATSGLLNSGTGSLISDRWVLTAASNVVDVRFIWVCYGVVNVINPTLVTETSVTRSNGPVALVSINRVVEFTDIIAPVGLIANEVADSISFCGYGANEDGGPGEVLSCFGVSASVEEDGSILATSDDGTTTEFDIGAPLVADGVQVGVLVKAGDESSAGSFAPTSAYLEWIQSETGLALIPTTTAAEAETTTAAADEEVKVIN